MAEEHSRREEEIVIAGSGLETNVKNAEAPSFMPGNALSAGRRAGVAALSALHPLCAPHVFSPLPSGRPQARDASVFQTRRASLPAQRLFRVLSALLLMGLLLPGCAAYQIGNASLYPPEIKTVYIPGFQSNSFRRNMGERLTEAVVKEVQKRTPYKVVSDPGADSVLSGCIVQDSKRVLVPLLSGDAREVQTSINVQVSWVDRRGRMLRDEKSSPLPPEIGEVSGTGDIVAETGQSVATAQQEAICKIAREIVDMMETPW